MRAFTLSSEPHFGTFQLIKTLIDDYITIAAARHDVFSPHSIDEIEALEGYDGGLTVSIPQLGDRFGSDPTTAVPAWRQQQQNLQYSIVDGQLDPGLFGGLGSSEGTVTTFSYNDQSFPAER